MAVQFIHDLPSTQVHNAFNNNIVRFKSSVNSDDIISATISIGQTALTVSPNPSGEFTYNFKELFKIVSNENHFRDGIYDQILNVYSVPYLKQDRNIFRLANVKYEIVHEDGSRDTVTRQYKILRAVDTLEDFRKKLTNRENPIIGLLSPMVANSNKTYYATIFDGYPFDISILMSSAQTVIVNNKTTSHQIIIPTTAGVNRLFFSDGISNLTLDNLLPIALGQNEIEIGVILSGQSLNPPKVTLFLTKKEACAGHLLKWYSSTGGWCYYLFQENKVEGEFREISNFPENSSNIEDQQSATTSTGYNSKKTIEIFGNHLDEKEKAYVDTIFGSPKVYLYLNEAFQEATKSSFLEVRINGSKVTMSERHLRFYDFFFEIEHPEINTLKM